MCLSTTYFIRYELHTSPFNRTLQNGCLIFELRVEDEDDGNEQGEDNVEEEEEKEKGDLEDYEMEEEVDDQGIKNCLLTQRRKFVKSLNAEHSGASSWTVENTSCSRTPGSFVTICSTATISPSPRERVIKKDGGATRDNMLQNIETRIAANCVYTDQANRVDPLV